MALAGVGAGINELTALAATSELAPTRKRGKYVAVLIFTIIPFCPSVLWGQLIASHAGWRYIGLLCGVWAAVGLFTTLFFYFPPPRVNSQGLTKKEVISRIDFVGGFLSIVGMILFMAGLQWGGYQVFRNPTLWLFGGTKTSSVLLEIRPCSGPSPPRGSFAHRIRRLGDQRHQVPHVSLSSKARTSHTRHDFGDHLHLWCQLLLHSHVLAHAGLQRLWSRPRRGRYPRYPSGLQYLGRSVHCAVAPEHLQRPQQGADDCVFSAYDCW